MTPAQRRVLVVAILASFVAFLDGSVVNVALPAISRDLAPPGTDATLDALALQQWVVDAYLVTLGSLILLAGSLSDVHGRKKVIVAGLVVFGVASVACALAPDGLVLVVARGVQGVGGALLVPSSLALIISAFSGHAQGRAIGVWTAWTSTAMIAGPLVGGLFVDSLSWRWVFGINVLPIAVTLWLVRGVAGGRPTGGRRLDVVGAVLATVGLAGVVLGLVELGHRGWASPVVWAPTVVGAAALVAFVVRERTASDPMLPMRLFGARNFAVGNVATLAVYGALTLMSFVVSIFLQQVAGYSAFQAGLAQLPPTLLTIGLSSRFGGLSGRYGARWFMAGGPCVMAAGMLLLLTTTADAVYVTQVLPGLVLLGLGLSITVAPLTAAILGAVPAADAGIGSAVNNAVSRVAGLVTVACAGIVVGATFDVDGFHRALVLCAVLFAVGGAVSAVGIVNRVDAPDDAAPDDAPAPGVPDAHADG
ncbi:MFS transporter [Luteimicrobium subarcticum]|uniref:MFS transporter n=1 Tax=Luteimicrobium subarcticum TaxID=620910 RepID=UPI000C23F8BF|nr:MFS transporter [Luteimicrobium subarcticum]